MNKESGHLPGGKVVLLKNLKKAAKKGNGNRLLEYVCKQIRTQGH